MILETEFSNIDRTVEKKVEIIYPFESLNKNKRILIFWREHCHECAPPLCYSNCKNYLERSDGKCQLINNGISRVDIAGSIHYSLQFRKWAKIEATSSKIVVSSNLDIVLNKLNDFAVKSLNQIPINSIKAKILNIYIFIKDYALRNLFTGKIYSPIMDIALFSNETKDYNLIIESNNYKRKILIQPGANSFLFKLPNNISANSIKWFPENDKMVSLILKKFDIVENDYHDVLNMLPKLVIWDLDNTLWDGVLVEGNIEDLHLRKGLVWTIKYLDSVGVVNSICSKNDLNNAKKALDFFGIWEYFVFPEINWNSKSENVKKILNNINLGYKNTIVIDDSPFERAEIASVFPEIKIFDETAFPKLLMDISFIDLKYNSESSKRRELYKTEQIRVQDFDKSVAKGNSISEFLKSCNIVVELINLNNSFTDSVVLSRCNELMSRTNQLNVSGVKFNDHDFNELIKDKTEKFYFSVSDSFGSYGIVGFLNCSVIENNIHVHNLVISCRVAKKLIENSIMNGLLYYYDSMKISNIIVEYKKTSRNTPIYESFIEMGFSLSDNKLVCHSIDLFDSSQIIQIKYGNCK
jgi:FkbH-like protein